ncbi:UNVERIFIED_CONTAM: hypothetical protein Sindi_2003000 [Sesamum indicum]
MGAHHSGALSLMMPPGPKVDWTSLLSGPLKIPRHMFILWLAILEKLATTDKPWLSHLGHCVLCNDHMVESHDTCSSTADLVDDASALYDAWYDFSGQIGKGHKILYGGHGNGVGNITSHCIPCTIRIVCLSYLEGEEH